MEPKNELVAELWTIIKSAIDDKITQASQHLANVIEVADGKISEAAKHAADALKAKEQAEEAGGDKANVDHKHVSSDITDSVFDLGTSESADKLVKTSREGRVFYSRTPTNLNEVVNLQTLKEEIETNVPKIPTHAIPWIGTRSEYNAISVYEDRLYVIVT